MKYKKGDKVKVLSSDFTYIKAGEEHILSYVNECDVFIKKEGVNWCFHLNEVEPYKEPKVMKYKKGDKVRVTRQTNEHSFNVGDVVECISSRVTVIGKLKCFEFSNGTGEQLLDERDFETYKEPKVMKYKIGDKVKYEGYKGVIVAIGTDGTFAVKLKGFDGHSCNCNISEGSVESIDFDGWWCVARELKLIKEPNDIKPEHYKTDKIDVIDFCKLYDLNFNLGNVVKYVSRAGKKESELTDLLKAKEYICREIEFLQTNKK
jgi:hypothetical protein